MSSPIWLEALASMEEAIPTTLGPIFGLALAYFHIWSIGRRGNFQNGFGRGGTVGNVVRTYANVRPSLAVGRGRRECPFSPSEPAFTTVLES